MVRIKRNKGWILSLIVILLAVYIAGCGQKADQKTAGEAAEFAENTGRVTAETNFFQDATVQLGEGGEKTVTFQREDWASDWNVEDVTGVVLNGSGITVDGSGAEVSGNVVTIHKSGTYVVSGDLTDGQICIDAGDDDLVRLVLNGVELFSQTTAPVYSKEKTKVIVTLENGTTNVIGDGADYKFEKEGEDEPDAPIFIKGDLTINGTGVLQVQGNYQSGIRSKGNLKVMSGTIVIDAQDDGLKGKDSVVVWDGDLTINAVKDGIKSNNDTDPECGYIWIEDGTIHIAAQDDGIQAETALIVRGGDIDITESQEGLAGKTVDILGGKIQAVAQDDGINAAATVETEHEKMMDQEGVYTRIAGGEIWLDTRADGIDSNGDFYMEGGALYLTGPDSGRDGILDYNGNAVITGGVVFAAGNSGMMQAFGKYSTQPFLVIYYSEVQDAGTTIRLTDTDGAQLGSYTPEREFDAMIISTPDIREGTAYRVATGEDTVELTVDGVETVSGEAPHRAMGGPGGGRDHGELRNPGGESEAGKPGSPGDEGNRGKMGESGDSGGEGNRDELRGSGPRGKRGQRDLPH